MNPSQTNVVVVEIDTRKGPVKTVFESAVQNQSEQAKVFQNNDLLRIESLHLFLLIKLNEKNFQAILEDSQSESTH